MNIRVARDRLARPAALLTVIVGLCGVPTAQSPKSAYPLHVAFASDVMPGLTHSEAEASISVWANELGRGRGVAIDATTKVYDDLNALGRYMASGKAHLVTMTAEQYWRLRTPAFGTLLIGQRSGRTGQKVLLLVRRGGGLTTLADLRGRSLVVLEGGGEGMARAWLDALLLEQGLGDAAAFFGTTVRVTKPSKAALPVFFGQRDACLVTEGAFDTLVEMNPQLGAGLVAVAMSPPIQHSVLLVAEDVDPAVRPDLIDALLTLHQTPRGQQVLSLFGRDRLVPGTPADLAPTLGLLAKLDALRKRGAKQ